MRDITESGKMPMVLPTIHHGYSKNHIGYILMEDIVWNGICIPRGFIYDGATIPQIFWSATGGPFHPRVMKAALIHDWLYLVHLMKQHEADAIFKQLLTEAGNHVFKRTTFHSAVYIFGASRFPVTERDRRYIKRLINMVEQRDQDPEDFKLITALNVA